MKLARAVALRDVKKSPWAPRVNVASQVASSSTSTGAVSAAGAIQLAGVVDGDREGFLAHDVLPGGEGGQGDLAVGVVRRGDVDRIDRGKGKQVAVIGEVERDAPIGGDLLSALGDGVADRED